MKRSAVVLTVLIGLALVLAIHAAPQARAADRTKSSRRPRLVVKAIGTTSIRPGESAYLYSAPWSRTWGAGAAEAGCRHAARSDAADRL
jgi:hypothetical protein